MVTLMMIVAAVASAAPERAVTSDTGVRVHRSTKAAPKTATPTKAEPSTSEIKVHKDKVPDAAKAPEPATEKIEEYDDDPVFSADIAFQRCLEREAASAATAKTALDDFKKALPNLCTVEETRLAQRYADSRVVGAPLRQEAGVPRAKSRALALSYTDALRQIVQAGYLNLGKTGAPMHIDQALKKKK